MPWLVVSFCVAVTLFMLRTSKNECLERHRSEIATGVRNESRLVKVSHNSKEERTLRPHCTCVCDASEPCSDNREYCVVAKVFSQFLSEDLLAIRFEEKRKCGVTSRNRYNAGLVRDLVVAGGATDVVVLVNIVAAKGGHELDVLLAGLLLGPNTKRARPRAAAGRERDA